MEKKNGLKRLGQDAGNTNTQNTKKCDKQNLENYEAISKLSIPSTVFSRILLNRLIKNEVWFAEIQVGCRIYQLQSYLQSDITKCPAEDYDICSGVGSLRLLYTLGIVVLKTDRDFDTIYGLLTALMVY